MNQEQVNKRIAEPYAQFLDTQIKNKAAYYAELKEKIYHRIPAIAGNCGTTDEDEI